MTEYPLNKEKTKKPFSGCARCCSFLRLPIERSKRDIRCGKEHCHDIILTSTPAFPKALPAKMLSELKNSAIAKRPQRMAARSHTRQVQLLECFCAGQGFSDVGGALKSNGIVAKIELLDGARLRPCASHEHVRTYGTSKEEACETLALKSFSKGICAIHLEKQS